MPALYYDKTRTKKGAMVMNLQNKTMKLVLAALFAALTCVATMMIQFPTLKGYIHFGDCFVILSGLILGPIYGGAAAGIGSMLADALSGYFVFAPATLIIKALGGAACGLVFQQLAKTSLNRSIKGVLSAIPHVFIVALGYFVFEIFYEGCHPALLEIIPNLIQGISGLVFAAILFPILTSVPALKNLVQKS
jgi:uncharacterized membrane protein